MEPEGYSKTYNRELYAGETINPDTIPFIDYWVEGELTDPTHWVWTGIPSDGKMPAYDIKVFGNEVGHQKTYYSVDYHSETPTTSQNKLGQILYKNDTSITPRMKSPTKSGHEFSDWYNLPAKMPSNNLTTYALWNAEPTYTVVFRVDGTQVGQTQTLAYDEIITLPANPTKTHYTFTGWSNIPSDLRMNRSNITADAQFTEVQQRSIEFYWNGGYDYRDNYTFYVGDPIVFPADPVWSGYTFMGWEPAYRYPAVSNGDPMPHYFFQMNAIWQDNTDYTLTYMMDGTSYTAQTYKAGDTIVMPTAPTKPGYRFVEWLNMPVSGKMPAKNLTVTASFDEATYTLTYMSEGSTYTVQYYKYDDSITLPDNPTKTHYHFTGWQDMPSTLKMPSNDLTVTAQFEEDPKYTVTYEYE